MKWYRINEADPDDWKDTETLLRLGAVHYKTLTGPQIVIRRFAMKMSEEDLVLLRLSVSNKVNIDVFDDSEYNNLKAMGYIRDDQEA